MSSPARATGSRVLRAGTNLGNGGMARGSGNVIALYDVSSLTSAPSMWPCAIADAVGGEFGKPTWSPGGDGLAWAEQDGIWTTAVGAGCATMAPRRVIAGGREPDWGPAAPGPPAQGPRRAAARRPARTPGWRSGRPSGCGRARCAPGSPCACAATRTCSATVTAHDGGRRVARATLSLPAGGEHRLRLRIPARAAARLGRRGHRVLRVRAEAAGASVARRVAVRR